MSQNAGGIVMEEEKIFQPIPMVESADRIVEEVDKTNAIILDAIWKYGPRNLSELGRATRIPRSTLTYRIERLLSLGLKVVPVVHLGYLGYEVVVAKIIPKSERLFTTYKMLSENPLLRSISVMLSPEREIYLRLYNKIGTNQAFEVLSKIRDEGLAESVYFEVCGDDVLTGNISGDYFREDIERYVYTWREWIRTVEISPTTEEVIVEEVREYERLDDTDMTILKMLVEDPMIDYVDMGDLLKVNYQTLRYHYIKHLKKSILGWNVLVAPIRSSEAYVLRVELEFPSTAKMHMFLNALKDSPLLWQVAKVKGKPLIFTGQVIPAGEAENLVWFYETLKSRGIIESFKISAMIPSSLRLSPIPPI